MLAIRIASRRLVRLAASLLLCTSISAQEPPKPPVISAQARLVTARRIFIEHAGARLPNDVIGDAFHGWGRYQLVGGPGEADLIVSISAPTSDSGVSVGSGGPGSGRHGTMVASTDVTQIRLLILDAHDRVVLWSGHEQPKSSMKEKQREDNVVDASLRLFRRFRNAVEPELAP
jgi:hypothetical protein